MLNGTLTVTTTVLGGVGPGEVAGNGTSSGDDHGDLAQINTTLADADGLVYQATAATRGRTR